MEDDFHVWDIVNYTRHFEPSIGFVHKYRAEGILLKCNQKITFSEALNYIRRGLNKYGDFLFQIIAMVDDDHITEIINDTTLNGNIIYRYWSDDGVLFSCDEKISKEEALAYIQRGQKKYSDEVLITIDAMIQGDEVVLAHKTKPIPFDRIRRITGYLVGTLDRFNDGKRAEEADRVKHQV